MSDYFEAIVLRCMPRSLICAFAGLVLAQSAHAQSGDIRFDRNCHGSTHVYASKVGLPLSASYKVTGWPGNVKINLNGGGLQCSSVDPSLHALTCGPLTVSAPAQAGEDFPNDTAIAMSSPTPLTDSHFEATWGTTVALSDYTVTCSDDYTVKVTSDGGGWGDPHLTTVDGVHYDFQSAGEFTALRDKHLEIQTRQTAVPTATVPIENPYTGITHCVAIYTAVAARLGSSRVSLQPGLALGEASPQGLQLRVNGKLTELTDKAIVLRSRDGTNESPVGSFEGAITKTADGTIQIADANGMQLVVTPAYWTSQSLWYLNVAVFQTSATLGTMGRIAPGSWLPALPDNSSLGARPASENQRYQDLYTTFADAWRVTDATSLFTYAPGQGTATFTRPEWPRNHPNTCDIAGQVSLQPTTPAVAAQACSGVSDARQRANCEFDVAITGQTDFGKAYQASQSFHPNGAGWVHANPEDNPQSALPWWKRFWIWLLALLAAIF